MSDDTESTGMENADLLRSSECDWLLDELPPPKEIAEVNTNPDTGEPEVGEDGKPLVTYKKLKALTLREQLFVREYCKNFNVKAAAKALEMETIAAHGFLRREHVRAAIHERASQMAKTCDTDQRWVLMNLREVVERCMEPSAFDPQCALRGLEMVGKTFAMFTDKVEKNQTTVIRIESNVPLPTGVDGSGGKVIDVKEEG